MHTMQILISLLLKEQSDQGYIVCHSICMFCYIVKPDCSSFRSYAKSLKCPNI